MTSKKSLFVYGLALAALVALATTLVSSGNLYGSDAGPVPTETLIRQEIFTRLDALTEKLGVATGHLWEVLIKQARVEAIQHIIFATCGLLMVVAAFYLCRLATRREHWADYSENIVRLQASIIGGLSGVGMVLINSTKILTPLLNPEYWALQRVLELIAGK